MKYNFNKGDIVFLKQQSYIDDSTLREVKGTCNLKLQVFYDCFNVYHNDDVYCKVIEGSIRYHNPSGTLLYKCTIGESAHVKANMLTLSKVSDNYKIF